MAANIEEEPPGFVDEPTESYCYGCLSKNDERSLGVHQLQNEALKSIFKMDHLILCFMCRRVAQHSEHFVRNVQQIQFLMHNVTDLIVLGNLKSDVRPLVNLQTLLPKDDDIMSVSGTDQGNQAQNCKVEVDIPKLHALQIKKEILESQNEPDPAEFLQLNNDYQQLYVYEDSSEDSSSSSSESEDEPPKKRKVKRENYIKQAKVKGMASTAHKRSESNFVIKSEKDGKKPKTGLLYSLLAQPLSNLPTGEGKPTHFQSKTTKYFSEAPGLNLNIKSTTLSKEECIAELAQMRNDEKYLEAPYRCHDCVKWFMMKETYEKHMELHKPSNGEFECEICKRRWPTMKQLNMHVQRHTNRFQCPKCEYTKKCRNMVKDHFLGKHLDGHYHYTCKICAKQYKCRLSLKKHIEDTHFKKEKIKCRFCDKLYKTKDSLRNHLITNHTEQVSTKIIKRYKCEECGRLFGNPSLLKNHSFVHNNIRNFYCVECDKRFATKNRLQAHLKTYIHTNYKQLPFTCPHCGKGFRIQRNLDQHVNGVHLKIRQFQCDICGKEYAGRRQLVLHIHTIHQGYDLPRHFPCSVCQKRFHDNRRLEAHMRTHTGEKPFKCPHCPAMFSQSGSLYNHNKLVHLKLTRKGTPKGEKSNNLFDNANILHQPQPPPLPMPQQLQPLPLHK